MQLQPDLDSERVPSLITLPVGFLCKRRILSFDHSLPVKSHVFYSSFSPHVLFATCVNLNLNSRLRCYTCISLEDVMSGIRRFSLSLVFLSLCQTQVLRVYLLCQAKFLLLGYISRPINGLNLILIKSADRVGLYYITIRPIKITRRRGTVYLN